MLNSTLCPLCTDGIGHDMDRQHAARVTELLGLLKTLSSSWGLSDEEIEPVMRRVRAVIQEKIA